ncbi:unnamed protein product [Phyllotreta striolata]|uniref:Uncharacterized protein n=1 Tax=Phyllotreta striolata TaxID=444603 RepID=A0A9N9TH22_PHYSR|nr:unnamed protein product [Phyllotreta striolata]
MFNRLLGWPFNEIEQAKFYIEEDEAITDKVDKGYPKILNNWLKKLLEETQDSTVSATENLIKSTQIQITSEIADSGFFENMHQANQEELSGKIVTEGSTSIPTNLLQNKTTMLGLDKIPIDQVQMSYEEITTLYNDDEYEDDGIASTMISGTTEVVTDTTYHDLILKHTMEDTLFNNCCKLLIILVVILIVLLVTAGVFLFYKKIKDGKERFSTSGFQNEGKQNQKSK